MSKTEVKKLVKKESNKFPFSLVELFMVNIPKLKVINYSDIKKFEEINKLLSTISNELSDKTRELLESYDIKDSISKEDSRFEEINSKYIEILNSVSSIDIDNFKLFTEEDFEKVFNGVGFESNIAIVLSNILIKK